MFMLWMIAGFMRFRLVNKLELVALTQMLESKCQLKKGVKC
nr:hypothetical protein Iba_chr03bCG18080 [Ipomoea batatas]GMC78093.1 hypothetical protein Iba_chr03fCG4740 [Ipomoea batatas]